MNPPQPFMAPFRLGEWLVRPDLNRIEGPEGQVQIEPRVMQVLVCLAETPGTVLTRMHLLDKVWADSVVGEEILTRAVSELRRVFGDSARHPRYIETIRNHGYRLIARPETVEVPAPAAEPNLPQPEPEAPAAPPELEPEPISSTGKKSLPVYLVLGAVLVLLVIRFGPGLWDKGQEQAVGPLTGAVPLTSYPGREWHPAFSPDGTRVAFIRQLPETGHSDLFIKQRNSEAALQLTQGPGWAAMPAWSPDGQTLAFVNVAEGDPALCTVSSLGGAVQKLLPVNSLVGGLDWSPDGTTLMFSTQDPGSGKSRLFQLNLASLVSSVLPPAEGDHAGDFQPRYSPDGVFLAWVSEAQDGVSYLFLRRTGDSRSWRLTPGLTDVRGLAWRPNSRGLVFASATAGTYRLWQLALDESGRPLAEPEIMTTGGEFAWYPTIARQTGDLAFEQIRVEQNLWRLEVKSQDPWLVETSPFAESTRWEYEAVFSPDGDRVALVSARSGAPEIWLSDSQGTGLRQLTHLLPDGIDSICWNSPGEMIAFNVLRGARRTVMTIKASGGQPTEFTAPGQQEIVSGWTPEGQGLVFGRETDQGWRVFRRNLDGSGEMALTEPGVLSARFSQDGKYLYRFGSTGEGIWRQAFKGGMPDGDLESILDPILDSMGFSSRGSWRVRNESIYYVFRSGGSHLLARFNLADGQTDFISDLPGYTGLPWGISPDGKSFIIAQQGEMAGDLALIPGK